MKLTKRQLRRIIKEAILNEDWQQSGVARYAQQQEEAIPPEVEAAILTALESVLDDDAFKTAIINDAMEREGVSVTPDNVTRTVGKVISQYQGL